MAKTKAAAADTPGAVEARVLVSCEFGKPNDVVTVSAEDAASGTEAGVLDANPDAVSYAKTLAA